MTQDGRPKWSTSDLVATTVFVLVAAAFAYYFASIRLVRGEWDKVPLEALIAGRALTPFQYRALVPWVLGILQDHVLPLPGLGSVRAVAFVFESGAIFLLLLTLRLYLGCFVRDRSQCSLLSLVFVLVLPFNYSLSNMWTFWFVYDMPSVLFFTIGLVLLYKRRWLPYYAVFVLATFNRETTCFLTLIYALTAWGKDGKARIAGHVLLQAAFWFAIKLVLLQLYRTNPGAGLSLNNVASNLRGLAQEPVRIAVLLSSLGYTWLPVLVLHKRIPDPFLRRACLAGPAFLAVMLVSGNLAELRIYGEMLPVFVPAFLVAIHSIAAGAGTGAGPDAPSGN